MKVSFILVRKWRCRNVFILAQCLLEHTLLSEESNAGGYRLAQGQAFWTVSFFGVLCCLCLMMFMFLQGCQSGVIGASSAREIDSIIIKSTIPPT